MSTQAEPFDELLFEQHKEKLQCAVLDFTKKAVGTAPAQRDRLEDAVSRIYRQWGLPSPLAFLWFDSPMSAAIAVLLLTELCGLTAHEMPMPKVSQQAIMSMSRLAVSPLDLRLFFQFAVRDDLTIQDRETAENYVEWLTARAAQGDPQDVELDRLFGSLARMEPLERVASQLTEKMSAQIPEGVDPLFDVPIDKKLWSQERQARFKYQRRRKVPLEEFAASEPSVEVARCLTWRHRTVEKFHCPVAAGMVLYHRFAHLLNKGDSQVEAYFDAFAAGGWWWPLDKICVVSENPSSLHLDGDNPGHESEAAVRFGDWEIWALGGVRVSEMVVTRSFCLKDIHNEPNVEVRRIMIERFGLGNFISESGAREVHSDKHGILYRIELEGDEPLTVLQVTNSTAEPDGSYRVYHLRVPPSMQTAREAVAWSFNLLEDEYDPLVQS